MASIAIGKIAKSNEGLKSSTSAAPALGAVSPTGRVSSNEQAAALQTKSKTNQAMPAFAQRSGMQDSARATPAVSRPGLLPADAESTPPLVRSVPEANSYFELQLALQQGDAVTSDSSETEMDM